MNPEQELREAIQTATEYYWDSVNPSRDGSAIWYYDLINKAIDQLIAKARDYHVEALIDRKRGD